MQIINKSDYVKRKIKLEYLKIISGLLLVVAGFFGLALGFVLNWLFFIIGFLLFVFGGMILSNRTGEVSIWKAGFVGQQMVPKALSMLPNEFVLINNVSIKDKNCDIDHVLISPRCLYAIESKNYNGEIYGQGDEWGYMKRGRAGGFYKGHIGNPAKQIKRSVWELKQMLDERLSKMSLDPNQFWIEPIVVFTNPNTILKVTDSTVKAMLLKNLPSYIQECDAKTQIPEDMLKAIIDILRNE
ncbi:MAG TPA: NERD domain-containing protein [Caldisericia bacterium]|nr:MAG: Nuclease-related domain protein [bacterium ADurb.Bin132]HNY61911.1 NERD domain-containing protein [Caldisericia bacterium]HOC80002.1 NERD domain-containing protein [Caldisericia bacterium]HOG70849.1 NERD domain-containing protein [Caldisericia bacterium]HPA66239.1 NERD domain-containing protein [Caldisericia bacterium]